MEEIEISSWLTLDAIKKAAEVIETVGNLPSEHIQSIFCVSEEDYLELYYSDAGTNYLRRFEDKDEFEMALEQRKEEEGETTIEEDIISDEEFANEEKSQNYDFDDETEKY